MIPTLGACTVTHSVVGVRGPGDVRGIERRQTRLVEVIAVDVPDRVVIIRVNGRAVRARQASVPVIALQPLVEGVRVARDARWSAVGGDGDAVAVEGHGRGGHLLGETLVSALLAISTHIHTQTQSRTLIFT